MTFLDLNTPGTATQAEAAKLPAGSHYVTITRFKYNLKADKAICVFSSADGAEYVEWLGMATDGAKKRSAAFLGHLCRLCGVAHNMRFDTVADFDALGDLIVQSGAQLVITLEDDAYNGTTRQVLAGRFSDSIVLSADAF